MRWLFVVVGVSVSTAACSLLVSLDGLDDGVGRPDASRADASRPDASRADASTPDVSTPDAHRDSGVDAAVVDSGHAVHDAGVDHATIADAGGSPYVAAVLEAGPYAYWRFEEKSGSVAHDQMGTVHEGAATGDVTVGVPGMIGLAVSFNNASGCIPINMGSDFEFPAPQSFSVELWIKAPISNDYAFVVTTEETDHGRWGWTLGVPGPSQGGPYPQFQAWNSGAIDGGYAWGAFASNGRHDGGALANGVWTYVVATFDGLHNVPSIYLNGALRAPGTVTVGLGDGGSLSLGCILINDEIVTSESFTGSIDEVAIYKYALSPEIISAHYKNALP